MANLYDTDYFRNYNNQLPNTQNNSGLAWWMNADRSRYSSPMMPGMLDQTGEMGAYTNIPQYRSETEKFKTRFDPTEIQAAPESTGIFENLKNKLKGFTTPTMEFLKAMGGEMSPEKRAEVEAIQGSADQYGWGNLPGTNLQGNIWKGGSGGDKVYVRAPDGTMILRDKNLQSWKGSNTIGDMLQKKEDWAKGRFEKFGDTWTDDEHKGISKDLYNYYKSTGALNKWRGQPSETITEKTITDKIAAPATKTGAGHDPNVHGPQDYGRGSDGQQSYDFGQGFGWSATGSGPVSNRTGRGRTDWAQGGRIGYREGELVDEDVNIQGPGFDINENVMMASDDTNTRILENLFEHYLDLGFSPAEAEKLALEEFESMAQGPQEEVVEEGIASLV